MRRSGRWGRSRSSSAIRLLVPVGALVLVASACLGPGPGPPPPPPDTTTPTVIVYGDSIATEAADYFRAFLATPGWNVMVHAYPGSAICDLFSLMNGEDAAINAKVVIMAFTGDMVTPCTQNRGSMAAVYTADGNTAAALWAKRGAKVLWATPPGDLTNPINNVDHWLAAVDQNVATQNGQSFVNAGLAVRAADGYWRFMLPCAPWETPEDGCQWNHLIQVRRSLDPPNGHLCPVNPTGANACPVYSAGIIRWGGAIYTSAKALMG